MTTIMSVECVICQEVILPDQRKYLPCGHMYCSPDPKNAETDPNPTPSPNPNSQNCYYKLVTNNNGKCILH